jgi:alternate signal-mediated exported protein
MKFRKIKKKPLIFLLVLCLLGIVGTTFAYYYTEIAIPNQFKAMTYNVTIEEEFNDTWGTKKVSFVNNEETNTPVVLRINYNELWRKEVNGVKLSLDNNVNGVNVVTKNWTTAFTNDFVDGGDGWYYYKKTLNAEESVQVLNSISLNESLISTSPYYNDYKTYTYELDFNFEAIQANSSAISEIWGKNATITGGDVTWS